MDYASRTIDRHEPIIPDSIQGDISVKQEHLMTKIKNSYVLRYCNVGQIKRWVKYKPTGTATEHQKIITNELLDRAKAAVEDCAGPLDNHLIEYLYERDINSDDINRFEICSTKELCKRLSADDITNLSLRISDKFASMVDTMEIDGISVPCYHNGVFHGFCTRVLNCDIIKYSITIPHRFCFGVDYSRGDKLNVVEGLFDAIRLIKTGVNTMAIGDSQPNYWKMTVANKFDHVNLLFDNDYSGMIGACKAHIILEEMLGRDPSTMSLLIPNEDPPSPIDSVKYSLRDIAAKLTELGREI